MVGICGLIMYSLFEMSVNNEVKELGIKHLLGLKKYKIILQFVIQVFLY
jgi:ABC-type antimicrobial peptide transport system permease subunit